MNIKIIGILVGVFGAGLFVWHLVKVLIGEDVGSGFMDHRLLSLVGGILILVGTGIYIVGRNGHKKRLSKNQPALRRENKKDL
ncbi:MAG: hypothetical protein ACR2L1_04735 [Pyrinomonadaceae bacterium]